MLLQRLVSVYIHLYYQPLIDVIDVVVCLSSDDQLWTGFASGLGCECERILVCAGYGNIPVLLVELVLGRSSVSVDTVSHCLARADWNAVCCIAPSSYVSACLLL